MRQLGELEAAIMAKVWDSTTPVSVRDVVEQLRAVRKPAYTTVMTVMVRLATKGLLRRHIEGRSWMYSPTLTRADYAAEQMQEVLQSYEDHSTVLLRFVDRMEAGELAALRAALSVDVEPEERR